MTIDFYSWSTPNGHKVAILLEELAVPYTPHAINIGAGDQFKPEFLAISPNSKIPALVDSDGPEGQPIHLFESAAIMLYLAKKHEKFWPKGVRKAAEAMQWLMFQVGGIGPMLGQNHHFNKYAPEIIPYACRRYIKESIRLYGVVNKQLEGRDYVCDDYSIVDMALFPWMRLHERQHVPLEPLEHVQAWLKRIENRPAVQRALEVMKEDRRAEFTPEEKEILFGISKS